MWGRAGGAGPSENTALGAGIVPWPGVLGAGPELAFRDPCWLGSKSLQSSRCQTNAYWLSITSALCEATSWQQLAQPSEKTSFNTCWMKPRSVLPPLRQWCLVFIFWGERGGLEQQAHTVSQPWISEPETKVSAGEALRRL